MGESVFNYLKGENMGTHELYSAAHGPVNIPPKKTPHHSLSLQERKKIKSDLS